jgi:hypothetical protein
MNFGGEEKSEDQDLEQIYKILDAGFSQGGNSVLGGSKGFMKRIIPLIPGG